jgi:LytS/YehU family sensor histidine kinase
LFLIPHFLLQKKIAGYLLLSSFFLKVAVNITVLLFAFSIAPFRTGKPAVMQWDLLWTINTTQVISAFSILTVCGIAISIKLFKKWYIKNDRNKKVEDEKKIMELEMLKAQVHPHFLFNTLNNLYSLTLINSDKAPAVVTALSDLMHYMLHECNEKEVPLDKEITVLKKYVELEKLRYGNRIDTSFSCSGNTHELLIAPLLLLPLVENSFKHGVSEQLDQCWINISLHAENDVLTFSLGNSFSRSATQSAIGGIGQQNIKKRLELIYPGKYELAIKQTEIMFGVILQVRLNRLPATTMIPALQQPGNRSAAKINYGISQLPTINGNHK